MELRILASSSNPALLRLPWHLPLEEWGEEYVIPLPRGAVPARGALRPGG